MKFNMTFNIIILIIFVIILLYIINKSYNKIVLENFIPHNKPQKLILEDCIHNFATDINHKDNKEELCYRSGFVTNPSLLAGICGNGDNKKPLHIIKDKEKLYYGCIGTRDKKINWNLHDRNFTQYELTPSLSNNLTIKNINPSNLIMFLTSDDNATVTANGKTYTHNGWNTLSTITLPNIKYNTEISCSFTNTGGAGGFCIAYIWNGQLYILSINGFNSSINSIELNENINNQVLQNKYNSSIPNMPSFMYNWYNLPEINTPLNLSLNAGVSSSVTSFLNNMTIFLAINGTGKVILNSKNEYNYSTPNKLINFDISNVLLGDKLIIDFQGINIKKGSPLLTISYIYKGYIFVLNNYNNNTKNIIDASNIISFQCQESQVSTSTEIMFAPQMTSSNNANGYVATASSVYQNNNGFTGPWNAFDNNVNTWWHTFTDSPNNLYNGTSGQYTGITQLTFTNSSGSQTTVKGEWLQLKLPSALPLTRYVIQGRQGCCGNPNGRDPNTWYILGWDGSRWHQVDYRSNIAFNWGILSFSVSNPKPYSSYLIITTVTGSNAIGVGDRSCLQIATWNLYTNTKYITNSSLITNSSVVTPPIITGWLGSSVETNNFSFSTHIGIK
jgi:hypothetical protein